jgi:hypothetical protein
MLNPPAPKASMDMWRRLAAVAAAVLLAASFLFPLWQMRMVAPQYPDGLVLQVYATKLVGGASDYVDDLAEINTLNHYIGMAELYGENFPELKVLPLGIGLAALLALLGATGRRGFIWAGLGVLGVVGTGGFASAFYRLYQYGHNLDPSAPVKVAPFTPVFLGTNQLANFTTTGSLGVGSYLLLAGALIGAVALLVRSRRARTA